jgi:hypothetical protein
MDPKIQLSDFELGLLKNSDWILTKNGIITKAQQLLGQVSENSVRYLQQNSHGLPSEVLQISPKISKGENYEGLPWLMLDYPRYFDKENVFAIRTMLWWGNFFSTTLHLSGRYKKKYSDSLISRFAELAENDFHVCVHQEQWHHHFEKENYLALTAIGRVKFTDAVHAEGFIKLSRKMPIDSWSDSVRLLTENWSQIVHWLS